MTPKQASLLSKLTPESAKNPAFYRAVPIKNKLGSVYFAQAIVGGSVKVGWAIRPRRRIAELRWQYCPPLILLASFPGTRRDENRVHRALTESRRNDPIVPAPYSISRIWPDGREWFTPTEDVRCVVEAFGGKLLVDPLPPMVHYLRAVCAERDRQRLQWSEDQQREAYAEWFQRFGAPSPVKAAS